MAKRVITFKLPKALKPHSPDYVTLDKRERSFRTFPMGLSNLSITKAAKAGWFYTGESCIVSHGEGKNCNNQLSFFLLGLATYMECYHCKIQMADWSEDNNPLLEHIKRNPDCPHIFLTKGEHFVRQMKNRLKVKNIQDITLPEVEGAADDDFMEGEYYITFFFSS